MKLQNLLLSNVADIPHVTESVKDKPLIELFKLYSAMAFHCKRWGGIGMSAVQVGIPYKFFLAKTSENDKDFRCFVDCEYEPLSDNKFKFIEGCLSLPNQAYLTERYVDVRVSGYELIVKKSGKDKIQPELVPFMEEMRTTPDANHLFHVVFQHEIDHHNNVLISNIGHLIHPSRVF